MNETSSKTFLASFAVKMLEHRHRVGQGVDYSDLLEEDPEWTSKNRKLFFFHYSPSLRGPTAVSCYVSRAESFTRSTNEVLGQGLDHL